MKYKVMSPYPSFINTKTHKKKMNKSETFILGLMENSSMFSFYYQPPSSKKDWKVCYYDKDMKVFVDNYNNEIPKGSKVHCCETAGVANSKKG